MIVDQHQFNHNDAVCSFELNHEHLSSHNFLVCSKQLLLCLELLLFLSHLVSVTLVGRE